MEGVLVILGLLAIGAFLLLPVLVIALWTKVNRLDDDVRRVRAELRSLRPEGPLPAPRTDVELPRRAVAPTSPPPSEPVLDVGEIEIVSPPRKQEGETPAAPIRDFIERRIAERTPLESAVDSADVETADTADEGKGFSLEELLAGKWLTWVGAVAVIIGAGFFFKYTIDEGIIGPTGRLVIGLLTGMIAFAGGAYAMLREYRFLAQGLVGAALGILYFALFAGYQWYDLLPQPVAFGGMALVTLASLAFSTIFRAQATAILGLLGGFLTPLMLSTGVDHQWGLFSYILLLDAGVLGIASFRKWQPLQIVAFLGTLFLWLGWFERHYEPAKLTDTVVLMTAFFLLFALLGVWHNALRKLPALPGDFILILATPIVYFIGLYGVTESRYAFLHGLLAVALAGTYLALALFQLSRNPGGKNVVLALGGVAASFLTIAIPLQLTGHWIAIAWAAESLLLVELGLRFGQPRLRYAGFGLLLVVQFILMWYGVRTLDNPGDFQTRFTRVDPVAVDVLPSGVIDRLRETGPMTDEEPGWSDVINGRSMSFLASALVLGVLAWEYRRRKGEDLAVAPVAEAAALHDATTPGAAALLLAAAPVGFLAMLLVETYAVSHWFGWLSVSMFGAFALWTAACGLALVWLASAVGPRWVERVGLAVFGVLAFLLFLSAVVTLGDWRSQWGRLVAEGLDAPWWRYPVVNPRGLGFVTAIMAAVAAAFIVRRPTADSGETDADSRAARLNPAAALGSFAYFTGLVLLTIETFAQGVIHEWRTATALAITGVWTLYAIGTLVAGILKRSSLVRILALALFLATTIKVFAYDIWYLDRGIRTLAFTGLGLSLLLVSYLYRRFRNRIRAWIAPASLLLACAGLPLTGSPLHAQEAPPPPAQTLAWRWPVADVPAADSGDSRYVRIAVPPDLFANARGDLADVRLLATDSRSATIDVPFVLVRPADHVELQEWSPPLLNLSQRDGDTEFLLDLSDAAAPVNELFIEIARGEQNYERAVTVYGADRRDPESWNTLGSEGYLLDRSRGQERLRVDRIPFPRSTFGFYRIVIEDDGQPPLTVLAAKLFHHHHVRVPRHEWPMQFVSRGDDAEHKTTVTTLDVGYDDLPTSGLRLEVAHAGDFHRSITVEGADKLDDERNWRSIAAGALYRIDRPGHDPALNLALEYPETTARNLRVTISRGDDAPIGLKTATALSIDRQIVCERTRLTAAGVTVALYAGDKELTAPDYDLARTWTPVEVPSLPAATLAPREPNPLFVGPTRPKVPWSEENQPLLWTVTIVGVLVFGALTFLLLKKAAQGGPVETAETE